MGFCSFTMKESTDAVKEHLEAHCVVPTANLTLVLALKSPVHPKLLQTFLSSIFIASPLRQRLISSTEFLSKKEEQIVSRKWQYIASRGFQERDLQFRFGRRNKENLTNFTWTGGVVLRYCQKLNRERYRRSTRLMATVHSLQQATTKRYLNKKSKKTNPHH